MFTNLQDVSTAIQAIEQSYYVSVTDPSGVIVYVNDNYCRLTGYRRDELVGRTHSLVSSGYHSASFYAQLWSTINENRIWRGEMKNRTRSGDIFWVAATIIPIHNAEEGITQFTGIFTDISDRKLTEEELRRTIKNLRDIKYALDESTIVAITDRHGIIRFVNDKFCEISKYSREELLGKTHRVVNSGHHTGSEFAAMWQTIRSGRIWTGDLKNRAKDGSEYWVSTTIVPLLGDDGEPEQYVAIRSNITDRKAAEEALAQALKNDFRQTVKNLQNCVFKYKKDEAGDFIFSLAEGKIAELLGFTTALCGGKSLQATFPYAAERMQAFFETGWQGEAIDFELTLRGRVLLVYLSPIMEAGQVIEVVGTASDISERKKAENRMNYLAYHDSLTGLPNRAHFHQEAEATLREAQRSGGAFALLFIDLDRFKTVNDTLGHAAGDRLLQAAAARLLQSVRDGDTISRQGGDEYAVLLPGAEAQDARAQSERILGRFAQSFLLGSMEVFVSPSIGISLYPGDGGDIDTLMKHADAAMYSAKEKGKNNYQYYTQALSRQATDKLRMESRLRKALEQQQFLLYYQPQIDLRTSRIIGMEALIRWRHPELGMVSPGEFIPLAEETGLIVPLGEWVLRTACRQNKAWQLAGLPPLPVSVNISLRQFMQGNLETVVKEALVESNLDPGYLELEITESMTSDVMHTGKLLASLSALGVKVSMDDFGTGYSSLSYLSKFPIHKLKIDQSFVRELHLSNQAIVKTIIDLAENLHMRVIAEGVETAEQAEFLKRHSCNEAQGFLYCRPVPEAQMTDWLQRLGNGDPLFAPEDGAQHLRN